MTKWIHLRTSRFTDPIEQDLKQMDPRFSGIKSRLLEKYAQHQQEVSEANKKVQAFLVQYQGPLSHTSHGNVLEFRWDRIAQQINEIYSDLLLASASMLDVFLLARFFHRFRATQALPVRDHVTADV